jgi:glycosyltransferase involved in cell wall biosynthesis
LALGLRTALREQHSTPEEILMKLAIAIPALNEEESIESIIQRSLAAREHIIRNSPVTDVEITVVSDGSTDRTVELASRYADFVRLIVFEKNRGYGAAIQEAWRQSDADLLGFLDADGTCEPRFFAPLCKTLVNERADVVLGCRLTKESRMPLIRRVGNLIFAALLQVFSSTRVRDTASGMRVVRRSSLPKLYPLPNGLHFTPAMSARSLLSDDLTIKEVDMPYHERQGESKLRVGKDGLRFLRVIVDTAFLYRPERPLRILGFTSWAAAAALMLMPSLYYLQHRSVAEWMIYRFIVGELFGIAAVLFLSASYLTKKIVNITMKGPDARSSSRTLIDRFFSSASLWIVPPVAMLAGTLLVIPSMLDLIRTGATYEHWSRFIVMSFLFASSMILIVTRGIDHVVNLLADHLEYLHDRYTYRSASEVVAKAHA